MKNIQKASEREEQLKDTFMLILSYKLSGNHMKIQIDIGDEDGYTQT